MSTRKIPIEDASDDELREFATTVLALELDAKVKSRADLLANISKAWTQPFITLAELPTLELNQTATPQPDVPLLPVSARYQDDPMVDMEIQSTSYAGGKDPVPVNVNGAQVVIQRNMRVRVPYRFYLALLDAHEVETLPGEKVGDELIENRISNFPLTTHSLPSAAEIAEWRERTDASVLG